MSTEKYPNFVAEPVPLFPGVSKPISIRSIKKYLADLRETNGTDKSETVAKVHFWSPSPEDVFEYVYAYKKDKLVEFLDTPQLDLMKNNIWLKRVEEEGKKTRFSLKYNTDTSSANHHFIVFQKQSAHTEEDIIKKLQQLKGGECFTSKNTCTTVASFTLTEYYFARPAIPEKSVNPETIEHPETYSDLKLEHLVRNDSRAGSQSKFEYCKFSLRINQHTKDDFLDEFGRNCYGANSGIIEYLYSQSRENSNYPTILNTLKQGKKTELLDYAPKHLQTTLEHMDLYKEFERRLGSFTFLYSLQSCSTLNPNEEYIVILEDSECDLNSLKRILRKKQVKMVYLPKSVSSNWAAVPRNPKLITLTYTLLNSIFGVMKSSGVEFSPSELRLAHLFWLHYFHQFDLYLDQEQLKDAAHNVINRYKEAALDEETDNLPSPDKLNEYQQEDIYEYLLDLKCDGMSRQVYQDIFTYLHYMAFTSTVNQEFFSRELFLALCSHHICMHPRRYLVEEMLRKLCEEKGWDFMQ